jgi:hypothetical protein
MANTQINQYKEEKWQSLLSIGISDTDSHCLLQGMVGRHPSITSSAFLQEAGNLQFPMAVTFYFLS